MGAPLTLPGGRGQTQPSPFQFEIEAVTLKFADRVMLHDEFGRAGVLRPMEIEGRRVATTESPEYTVEFGRLSRANVRNGVLRIDQNATTNRWIRSLGSARAADAPARRLHLADDAAD
jgi:hypothetical protein